MLLLYALFVLFSIFEEQTSNHMFLFQLIHIFKLNVCKLPKDFGINGHVVVALF